MSIPFILSLIAAVCIVPTLVAGAISDLKTRTFPARYWVYTAKIAGFFVFLQYCMMLSNGEWIAVLLLLSLSVISSIVFFIISIRCGSGGDWRAMIYIAWISPALLIATCVLSILIGGIQAIIELGKKDDVSVFMRGVPFAVAICIAFVISIGLSAVGIL